MSDTYMIRKKCKNCDRDNTLEIQKGTLVEDFIKDNSKKCYYCGCAFPIKEKGGKKNE